MNQEKEPEFFVSVPWCYKCDPVQAGRTYAPIGHANYKCSQCGHVYTIPTPVQAQAEPEMNQENQLLEKVKEQYALETGNTEWQDANGKYCQKLKDSDWEIISQRYANELLKLRLGEVVKKIQTVKIDLSDSAYASGLEYGLALSITIIDKTLKEL